ncbi:glycosyltransferase family 2 protein [Planomicrobium sp. CPCC 101110]|uniref:glycosyltransferase family 2 protein n=1 Tax=Planomicrobium sp. CPCC 101110 TaxID=2599619 RepID=UPI0011B3F2B6|nr:glycosyltransferase family 2 protein [Planomicrobium sp. CPCC 101110]TWT27873.1 glycosyltransferase family 2 protein [Planomicrobium sp. CPCC 101110]
MKKLYTKIFNEKEISYNQQGMFIKNRDTLLKPSQVTVVTPVYNAEKFLRKTIDSVIKQSLQFKNIEFILVDDCSTDSSRSIIWKYAQQYANIVAVFLEKNTGSPSTPRNIGIELATSEWICFLDADDWLKEDCLEKLVAILDQTGDDYAVGKTIKETSTGSKIVGEHQSCMERRSVSPFSISDMFHHMGSNAKIMKRQLLMDCNIRFPDMKYAEDKQFYMDVIIHSKTVSTTKHATSYLNRLDENGSSLTKQTDVFEKMDTNLKVIEHIKKKKLPIEQEKMVLNRLYEFDFIIQLFDPAHFLDSCNKQAYYSKFKEALDTAEGLGYDISDNFFYPISKIIYQLYKQRKYSSLEALIKWNNEEKNKQFIIKDNMPYMVVPFLKGTYRYIRVPMLAIYINEHLSGKRDSLKFKVFGDYTQHVNGLIFRSRKNANEEYVFDFKVEDDGGEVYYTASIPLKTFSSSNFEKFIQYDSFRKLRFVQPNQVRFTQEIYSISAPAPAQADSILS